MTKQIIAFFVAALFSVASFANNSEPTLISKGNKAFKIDAKVWKSSSVDVKIADVKGNVFFTDRQKTTNNIQYNLTNLPQGEYRITVSNEVKSVVQTIEITSNEIVLKEDATTTFAPHIVKNNNNLDVNFLSNGESTNIYIFQNDKNVYSTTLDNQVSINKRFNLEKLPAGTYTVSVENNSKIYTKTFKK